MTVNKPEIGELVKTVNELVDAVNAQSDASVAGSPVVRAFPFAFDTPDLLTGAALYTPTIGDIFLDAWLAIGTAWDGTTPKGDFGGFVDDGGWLAYFSNGPADMTFVDDSGPDGMFAIQAPGSGQNQDLRGAALQSFGSGGLESLKRSPLPATFSLASPIRVVVSQNGQSGGADPGSTQGAAIFYLVTATPA